MPQSRILKREVLPMPSAVAAVVVIERLALGYDRTPLEWRRSRGPADEFQYHVEIR